MLRFSDEQPVRRIPVRYANTKQRQKPTGVNQHPDQILSSDSQHQTQRVRPQQRSTATEEATQSDRHAGQKSSPASGPQPVEVEQSSQPEAQQSPTSETDWQTVASRLQADMHNFRDRQKRLAEEAAVNERARLLSRMLPVIDNLTRALQQNGSETAALRQGVELTYREFMRLMAAEGVAKVEAIGRSFDPNVHEAVAIVPGQSEPDKIVEEIEAGYTLNDKLLRPAKVVVAS